MSDIFLSIPLMNTVNKDVNNKYNLAKKEIKIESKSNNKFKKKIK